MRWNGSRRGSGGAPAEACPGRFLDATAGVPVRVLAARVDRLRGRILAVTLRVRLFDRIFRNRTKRLAVIFTISVLVALTLSLNFPLWMLLIVPLVLGVPHLVSSTIFVPRLTGAREAPSTAMAMQTGAVFVAVAAIQLWAEERPLRSWSACQTASS